MAIAEAWRSVARFPLSSAPAYSATLLQMALDLLAAMSQLRRPHRFSCDSADDCNAARFAAWIELEAQRLKLGRLHGCVEDDRERIAAIDCRLALCEQQTGPAWMHWT